MRAASEFAGLTIAISVIVPKIACFGVGQAFGFRRADHSFDAASYSRRRFACIGPKGARFALSHRVLTLIASDDHDRLNLWIIIMVTSFLTPRAVA
jgi:hypothetical protein